MWYLHVDSYSVDTSSEVSIAGVLRPCGISMLIHIQ